MAGQDFDFDAFRGQKFAEYKKKDIKPAIVRKAKAGVIFTDYKLAGKKIPCVFIPMKKVPEALNLFKQVKASKEHILKKTALVAVTVGKADDGSEKITLEIKKGGLSRDFIIAKGMDLFETTIKMKLDVMGGADAPAEEAAQEEVQEEDGATAAPVDEAKKAKALKALNTIKANADKVKGAVGKIDPEKIKSNAEKLKGAFDKVMGEVREFIDDVGDEAKELVQDVRDIIQDLFDGKNDGDAGQTQSGQTLDKVKVQGYAKEGKVIAADFKKLQKTIKKNLADMQSEQSDVDLVNAMIERVQTHEDVFDDMNDLEKEKVQKMRDTIKSKVAPELNKMMQDVLRYLKVREKVMANKAKNRQQAQSKIEEMKARLEQLKADLAQ